MAPPLSSLALNCTLKRSSGEPSSTDVLLDLIDDELRSFEVTTDRIRIADHQVLPGVTSDAGDGDEWPAIRQRVLDADLVVIGRQRQSALSSFLLGSTAQRVLNAAPSDVLVVPQDGSSVARAAEDRWTPSPARFEGTHDQGHVTAS